MTRLVRAELLKLATVRSPFGLLGGVVLIAAVASAGTVASGAADGPEGARQLGDAAATTWLLALILGVLVVTSEFRHGTITQTFLATPVRERVLGAKLLAGTAAGLGLGAAALAAALGVGLAWSSARGYDVGLDGAAGARYLRLLGVYALAAALGVGVGALVRSQVGAIVGTFAWFLMAEPLLTIVGILLVDENDDLGPVGRYLPGTAFEALAGGGVGSFTDGLPSPLAGLGLVLVYVAALASAGAAALVGRDPK